MSSAATGETMLTLQRTANKVARKWGKTLRGWIAYRLNYAMINMGDPVWLPNRCIIKGTANIHLQKDCWGRDLIPFARGAVYKCPTLLGHCLGQIGAGSRAMRHQLAGLNWHIEVDGDLRYDAADERLTFPVKIVGEVDNHLGAEARVRTIK